MVQCKPFASANASCEHASTQYPGSLVHSSSHRFSIQKTKEAKRACNGHTSLQAANPDERHAGTRRPYTHTFPSPHSAGAGAGVGGNAARIETLGLGARSPCVPRRSTALFSCFCSIQRPFAFLSQFLVRYLLKFSANLVVIYLILVILHLSK